MSDRINPPYYRRAGMEVADIIAAWGLSYNLGVALAYILRSGKKTPDPTDDLTKVLWHVEDELKRIRARQAAPDAGRALSNQLSNQPQSRGMQEALERWENMRGKP